MPCRKYGVERASGVSNNQTSGNESKIPKPERIEVLPVLNGSQTKPIRGEKLRSVGLRYRIGPPTVTSESVGFFSSATVPLTSFGIVRNSYRTPILNVRLLL